MVTWRDPLGSVGWSGRYVVFRCWNGSGMLRGYYDMAPRSGSIVSVGLGEMW